MADSGGNRGWLSKKVSYGEDAVALLATGTTMKTACDLKGMRGDLFIRVLPIESLKFSSLILTHRSTRACDFENITQCLVFVK